jgi:uncharacterized membrane protein
MSSKRRRNNQGSSNNQQPVQIPQHPNQKPLAQAMSQNFPQMQQIAGIATTSYQGPIPHPDILKGFDALVPGSAKTLIDLAMTESSHRRELESKALEANIFAQKKQLEITEYQNKAVFRTDLSGQILGAVTSLFCIVSAVYLIMNGHEGAAMVLASIPIGAIVKSFMPEKLKFWKK